MENKGFIVVNLLPYREKIKKDKLRQFGLLMALFVVAAGAVIFTGHTYLSIRQSEQESRNSYIENENKKLDDQIKEIANLKDEIKDTLAKRKVVEDLQTTRSDTVAILNEISKQLPEGMVLKEVKEEEKDNNGKKKTKITINGLTQSNAKVSNYMSNLENTSIFENSQLVEVKLLPPATGTVGKQQKVSSDVRTSEFTLTIDLKGKDDDVSESKNKKKTMDNVNK